MLAVVAHSLNYAQTAANRQAVGAARRWRGGLKPLIPRPGVTPAARSHRPTERTPNRTLTPPAYTLPRNCTRAAEDSLLP
jgi:hypothetical protein